MGPLRKIIRLIRAYQWSKSGFIILPFIFSDNFPGFIAAPLANSSLFDISRLLMAFFGFSFLASAGYVLNDWKDRELDRLHPIKKRRPLASGEVSTAVGFITGALLFGIAFFLGFRLSNGVLSIFLAYLIINILFYSYIGKKIILLDVFIIASGFVFRVIVGALALDIEASPWLCSVTFFIALFLGFSKRFSEVKSSPERLLGGNYTSAILQNFISISGALCIMNYTIYCIMGRHSDDQLIWTVPLVVLGIFRYYIIAHNQEPDKDGNPSDVLLADKFLLLIIFCWAVLCATLILYN